MKVNEFIRDLSEELDCTKTDAKAIVRGFWACVARALKAGERVKFPQYGAFYLHRFGERNKYNINSGETEVLEPVTRLEFQCAPNLREMIADAIPRTDGEEDEETDKDAPEDAEVM